MQVVEPEVIMTFRRYFQADKQYSLYSIWFKVEDSTYECVGLSSTEFDKYLPEGFYRCTKDEVGFLVRECELGKIHIVNGVAPRKTTGCIATALLFSETLEAMSHNFFVNRMKLDTFTLEVRR